MTISIAALKRDIEIIQKAISPTEKDEYARIGKEINEELGRFDQWMTEEAAKLTDADVSRICGEIAELDKRIDEQSANTTYTKNITRSQKGNINVDIEDYADVIEWAYRKNLLYYYYCQKRQAEENDEV